MNPECLAKCPYIRVSALHLDTSVSSTDATDAQSAAYLAQNNTICQAGSFLLEALQQSAQCPQPIESTPIGNHIAANTAKLVTLKEGPARRYVCALRPSFAWIPDSNN